MHPTKMPRFGMSIAGGESHY